MLVVVGKKYLFMTQRYAYSGTVEAVTPTHVTLGPDAQVHYENIGLFEEWSRGVPPRGKSGAVPGQGVCMLGTDFTPIRPSLAV